MLTEHSLKKSSSQRNFKKFGKFMQSCRTSYFKDCKGMIFVELSEPPPLPLAITFDSSSPIYSNGWKTEYALDNKGNTGFITRANKGGWIKFKFPLSYVSKVRVQNRHNCCGKNICKSDLQSHVDAPEVDHNFLGL